MMKNNPEELELAKEVARKAKKLAQERQDKMLATVRAEFYVQLSEVLKAGVVKAATWHVGEATPPADFGRAGDLYLDITTADVLFNNAGEWQVVLNVRPKDGEDGKDADPVDYSRIESKISELTKEEASKIKPEKVNYEKVNSSIKEEVSKLKPEKVNYDKVTSEIKEEVKKEVSRIPKPKDGKDGSKWYAEKGKPTYTIGKKGDLYIDSNTGDFYQKTSDLSWVRKGSLKGESVAGGFIVSNNSSGSGEGGAVDSVNEQTGDVVLTQDDIEDGTTYKQFSATEKTKLAGLSDVATSGDYSDLSNTPDLSVFDDLEQYSNTAGFPATGDATKFYLAIDTGTLYRWGGSSYVEISGSLALGETSSTAYRGDRGKTAYDHSQASGNPHGTTKTDLGLGNVDNTSDANKPVSTATQTALDAKLDDTQFSGLSKITVGTSAPSSPAVGDLWVDTN